MNQTTNAWEPPLSATSRARACLQMMYLVPKQGRAPQVKQALDKLS